MMDLELADSYKTMNRPDPTVTIFDGLFLGMYCSQERDILPAIQILIQVVLFKFGIDVYYSLETELFGNVANI